MPMASRTVVRWPNMTRATICANSTSIKASVRTLAAVAMAKARNQNCEASAPIRPANSDGFQARRMAIIADGWRSHR